MSGFECDIQKDSNSGNKMKMKI